MDLISKKISKNSILAEIGIDNTLKKYLMTMTPHLKLEGVQTPWFDDVANTLVKISANLMVGVVSVVDDIALTALEVGAMGATAVVGLVVAPILSGFLPKASWIILYVTHIGT